MANPSGTSHVYAGTAGWTSGATRSGIFRRAVGDDRWEQLTKGLPERLNVQAVTVHPTNHDLVYIGTDQGPYRSADRGERWDRLAFPEGLQVWSILVHPGKPQTVYAGTSPVGVFRSDDGGDTWRKLPKAVQPDRVKMNFACRVMRRLDGGETWEDCCADLVKLAEQPHLKSRIASDTEIEGMLDGHALCVS